MGNSKPTNEDRSLRIPSECVELMNKHVTESNSDRQVYIDRTIKDYDCFSDFIGSPSIVLDLGCGLGRLSACLHQWAGLDDTLFILADADRVDDRIKTGWDPGEEYYNQMGATTAFVEANGVKHYRLFNILEDDWSLLPKLDLVVSLLSVGFHFPLAPELKKFSERLTKDARLIFQVRKGRYQAEQFRDEFSFCELRPRDRKSDFLLLGKTSR